DGTWIARSEIRYLSPLTEEEQAKTAERYGADGAPFKTRLVMSDRSLRLARESIEELRDGQGLALVLIGQDKWVPAANIVAAKDYRPEDAEKAKAKGLNMSAEFRSRVETAAGSILGTEVPRKVMEARAAALERAARTII